MPAGRPKKDDKVQPITGYFPPIVRAKIKAVADADRRSESQALVILAEEGLAAREAKRSRKAASP